MFGRPRNINDSITGHPPDEPSVNLHLACHAESDYTHEDPRFILYLLLANGSKFDLKRKKKKHKKA